MAMESQQPAPLIPQKRRILQKVRSWLIQLLLLLLVVIVVDGWLTRNNAHGMAPAIVGSTIAGDPFNIDELRGEVVLLHFWGTWCPICNLEHGTIDSINRDFRVISVALQSGSDAEIASHLHSKGLSYPVVNDNHGEISARYGVSSVPVSFVLDSHGEIRYVTRGYTSELGLRFRLWLASL